MTPAAQCPDRRGDEAAARWVAGTLSGDEQTEFEVHLLVCPACQNAVAHATSLRAALHDLPAVTPRRRHPRWVLPAGLAAAAALVLMVWPDRNRLGRLAEVGPAPRFEPAPVRAGQGATTADRGMAAYGAGDYRTAARLLDSALVVDPTIGTRFYLGVSLIKIGNARAAAAALGPVASDSTSPYAADAALWLAKAWLRAGQPDSAEAVLARLDGRSGEPSLVAHVRALADSIREVRRH